MTRQIIKQDENYNVMINTFWDGHQEGVQITDVNTSKWVHLTRAEAIEVFGKALRRLKKQVKEDKTNPPFWQELSKVEE